MLKVLSFQHEINIKYINETFYILFSKSLKSSMFFVYTYTSPFTLATFEAPLATCDRWLPSWEEQVWKASALSFKRSLPALERSSPDNLCLSLSASLCSSASLSLLIILPLDLSVLTHRLPPLALSCVSIPSLLSDSPSLDHGVWLASFSSVCGFSPRRSASPLSPSLIYIDGLQQRSCVLQVFLQLLNVYLPILQLLHHVAKPVGGVQRTCLGAATLSREQDTSNRMDACSRNSRSLL